MLVKRLVRPSDESRGSSQLHGFGFMTLGLCVKWSLVLVLAKVLGSKDVMGQSSEIGHERIHHPIGSPLLIIVFLAKTKIIVRSC